MKYFLLFLVLFPVGILAECTQIEQGKRCLLKIGHYPQPVFIFIPQHFQTEKNFSLLLFLHGHLQPNTTYQTDVLERFHFEEKMEKIRRNMIMVMPMSTGQNKDYDDYFLNSPHAHKNFQEFMSALNLTLTELDLNLELKNKLILAGHSGAYRHLAKFMSYDIEKLNELYLFDCLYNKYNAPEIFAETFLRFQKENKRILSFYKIGSATDQSNFLMWQAMSGHSPEMTQERFYQESLSVDSSIPDQTIRQSFIKTQNNHYQIVDDYFIWALESGGIL